MEILFLAVVFVVNAVECKMSEQELIFRMFVCEFMGWYCNEYVVNEYINDSALFRKVCDALRCEE